ncbi:MAG: YidB family protein [Rhodomicrobium sp.]|jgi:uncharacterized protein YidB (DUF937 family)
MGANSLAGAVEDYIRSQGGVSGLVKKLEDKGLGSIARSWTDPGHNHPVTAAQIHRAIGFETLADFGKKWKLSPDATAEKLAELLPAAIDKLTVRKGTASAPYPWTGTRKR